MLPVLAFSSTGFLVGVITAFSSDHLARVIVPLIFALFGGSILTFGQKLPSEQRNVAYLSLLSISTGCAVGIIVGVLCVEYRWLSPRIEGQLTGASVSGGKTATSGPSSYLRGIDVTRLNAIELERSQSWRQLTVSTRYVSGLLLALSLCGNALASDIDETVFIKADKTGNKVEFGTGFFVDNNGLVVTAYHVINGARQITVWDDRNTQKSSADKVVKVLAMDSKTDVALLATGFSGTKYFKLDMSNPAVGQQLKIIGHPYGFRDQTLSAQTTQDGFAKSKA
ncbi:conserved hypothetical protein [Ricinus communis]|uniref:Serine protease n=1 Tax=Ricinus communis TaxID=3988 RepID=B9TBZ1_RICCO|nr:conserved hypothetical protein [Ricinus communis]